MGQPPAAQVASNSCGSLLKTGKYSDVTLICEGQEIAAHKLILCGRSPVWAAACDGAFQEARTGRIDVGITDVGTLRHLLHYLYTDVYSSEMPPDCDDPVDGDDNSSNRAEYEHEDGEEGREEVVEEDDDDEEEEEEGQAAEMEEADEGNAGPDTQETEQEQAQKSSQTLYSTNDKTDISPNAFKAAPPEPSIGETNRILIHHTRVYAAADYYQIMDLRDEARNQFLKAVTFESEGWVDLIKLVYSVTLSGVALAIPEFRDDVFSQLTKDLWHWFNEFRKQKEQNEKRSAENVELRKKVEAQRHEIKKLTKSNKRKREEEQRRRRMETQGPANNTISFISFDPRRSDVSILLEVSEAI
ncbi:MAG: hypothetical protein M1831_002576 [Alyxoria varia]|nr:MAG: hypothetical protein M1831_002576 [Alyxoria varia]